MHDGRIRMIDPGRTEIEDLAGRPSPEAEGQWADRLLTILQTKHRLLQRIRREPVRVLRRLGAPAEFLAAAAAKEVETLWTLPYLNLDPHRDI